MSFFTAQTSTKAPGTKRSVPWVEKYRPEKVEDVSHQEEVVATLKKSIDQGSVPHLLFHGPPGTGKTTAVLALARALYGPELYRQRILELNASDERGIKVIREKVKTFAQGTVGAQKTPGYPCPRFKLIILDEADTMTPEAQAALRRIIENYSKVTRFCLICNYVTRVIEPLASRCAKFRFQPLPTESMRSRVMFIAEKEGVLLDENAASTIIDCSGGDMRKAVTYLQSVHQMTPPGQPISAAEVIDISGRVPPDVMAKLWASVKKGSTFDKMQEVVQHIINEGFPMSTVFTQLLDELVAQDFTTLSDLDKAIVCEKVASADLCLLDGGTELLHLLDVVALLMRRIQKVGTGFGEFSAPPAH